MLSVVTQFYNNAQNKGCFVFLGQECLLFLKNQIVYKITQFQNNADNKGCFTFLGEETKLTWIDATLACEQVISYWVNP